MVRALCLVHFFQKNPCTIAIMLITKLIYIALALPMALALEIPTITLNNGIKIPVVGLGTSKSKANQLIQAVKDAIDSGYRHFDCAFIYKNEKEIGQALAEKLAEGVVQRKDLFITSKLWNNKHKPEDVEGALRNTLKDLQLDYLDLYLIHWPVGLKENAVDYSDDDYVDTWKEMEKMQQKGLAKSIGISNFNITQIERLLEHSTIVPVTNQIECHPYLTQEKLVSFCKSKNITVTAYSPFAQAASPFPDEPQVPPLFDNPEIKQISSRLQKSPAQVILRYSVQRGGVIVIPKSVTKSRIIENGQIFDFVLTDEDMKRIGGLNVNGRRVRPQWIKHKYYPFLDV